VLQVDTGPGVGRGSTAADVPSLRQRRLLWRSREVPPSETVDKEASTTEAARATRTDPRPNGQESPEVGGTQAFVEADDDERKPRSRIRESISQRKLKLGNLTLDIPRNRVASSLTSSEASNSPVNEASDRSGSLSLLQRRQQAGLSSLSLLSMAPIGEAPRANQPRHRTSEDSEKLDRSPDRINEPKVILEKPGIKGNSPPPRRCRLPGAFPHQRAVFFFDWDDTLCPTTWIRSVLKGLIDDRLEFDTKAIDTMVDWRDMIPQWFRHTLPDDDFVHDAIKDLQRRAIEVIKVAQLFGVVCIVTNSLPGWVDMTIKKWMPELTQYIHGHGSIPPIKVLYSQQVKARSTCDLASIPEADEYALMKRDAMSLALNEVEDLYRMADEDAEAGCSRSSWCASGDAKRVSSIVSIGNDEAEMKGAELAALGYESWRQAPCKGSPRPASARAGCLQSDSAAVAPRPWRSPRASSLVRTGRLPPHGPWLKRVKFTECPNVRDLTVHLEETARLLPQLAGLWCHERLDLEASREARSAAATPRVEGLAGGRPTTRLPAQRPGSLGLWVQTV